MQCYALKQKEPSLFANCNVDELEQLKTNWDSVFCAVDLDALLTEKENIVQFICNYEMEK